MKMKWTKEEIAAHRKAWIAALRSGKYRQRRDTLRGRISSRHPYTYCVLGVACELADAGEWVSTSTYKFNIYVGMSLTDTEESDMHMRGDVSRYYGFCGTGGHIKVERLTQGTIDKLLCHWDKVRSTALPLAVQDRLARGHGEVNLSTLNDHGVKFDLLADVIEEGLPDPDPLIVAK